MALQLDLDRRSAVFTLRNGHIILYRPAIRQFARAPQVRLNLKKSIELIDNAPKIIYNTGHVDVQHKEPG